MRAASSSGFRHVGQSGAGLMTVSFVVEVRGLEHRHGKLYFERWYRNSVYESSLLAEDCASGLRSSGEVVRVRPVVG